MPKKKTKTTQKGENPYKPITVPPEVHKHVFDFYENMPPISKWTQRRVYLEAHFTLQNPGESAAKIANIPTDILMARVGYGYQKIGYEENNIAIPAKVKDRINQAFSDFSKSLLITKNKKETKPKQKRKKKVMPKKKNTTASLEKPKPKKFSGRGRVPAEGRDERGINPKEVASHYLYDLLLSNNEKKYSDEKLQSMVKAKFPEIGEFANPEVNKVSKYRKNLNSGIVGNIKLSDSEKIKRYDAKKNEIPERKRGRPVGSGKKADAKPKVTKKTAKKASKKAV